MFRESIITHGAHYYTGSQLLQGVNYYALITWSAYYTLITWRLNLSSESIMAQNGQYAKR